MKSPSEAGAASSESPRENSWIPTSAQIPNNVSLLRKRKSATPALPDIRDMRHPSTPGKYQSQNRASKRVKIGTPPPDKREDRHIHGYKITLDMSPSASQRRQWKPFPINARPARTRAEPLEYIPGNEPKFNTPLKARPPIVVQKNGVALPQTMMFEPWNLNSRGHQEADGRGQSGTGWRKAREQKLKGQWSGTELYDSKLATGGQQSILDCWQNRANGSMDSVHKESQETTKPVLKDDSTACIKGEANIEQKSHIFRNLVFYVNGSTYPHVGDHHLKSLISQHGGTMTLGLQRKRVTHVILTPKLPATLGTESTNGPSAGPLSSQSRSAGGGLAAGKLQKQMKVTCGPSLGIRFISPAWITESIEAGHRLPESSFSDWRMTSEKQGSVLDRFIGRRNQSTWQSSINNEN